MHRFSTLILVLAGWPMASLASTVDGTQGDTTLSLDFQIRVRSEWRDGYRLTATDANTGDLTTVQRNRLGISGAWNKLEFKLQLQDVRNHGGLAGPTSNNMGAAAAWAAIPLTEKIKLTFGRQFVDIDNGRIVGAADWANPGRFLDGVRVDFQRGKGNTLLLASWDEAAGTQRNVAYHMGTLDDGRHRYSLLLFDQASSSEADMTTAGGTWKWTPSPQAWWTTEAYVQRPDGGGTAIMWVLEGGMKRANGSRNSWGLDFLSGSGNGTAFNPVLGTNHKFYGWIDHFYVGAASDGLIAAKLNHMVPCFSQRAALGATFHHFRTPDDRSLLGNELDLWLTGKHSSGLQWHVGWSMMDPTLRHVERQGHLSSNEANAAAGVLQQWGWVSLNLNPSILLK